jgi:hypothetical protein
VLLLASIYNNADASKDFKRCCCLPYLKNAAASVLARILVKLLPINILKYANVLQDAGSCKKFKRCCCLQVSKTMLLHSKKVMLLLARILGDAAGCDYFK